MWPSGTGTIPANAQGTTLLADTNGDDHSLAHRQIGSQINQLPTVFGSSPGTNILNPGIKNASDQLFALNSGGTANQTITKGTINNAVMGSQSATGGTFTAPVFAGAGTNNGTIQGGMYGSAAIQGGTFGGTITNNALVNNGTYNTPVVMNWNIWESDANTWTYTNGSQVTISADMTTYYKKGVKAKFIQGGTVNYMFIQSSSVTSGTTTVTFCPTLDYTLANAVITSSQYSYGAPPDYPSFFNYQAITTGFSGTLGTYQYSIINGECQIYVSNNQAGSSNSGTFNITTPINVGSPSGVVYFYQSGLTVFDSNSWSATSGVAGAQCGTNVIKFGKDATTLAVNAFAGFTASSNKAVEGIISYPI